MANELWDQYQPRPPRNKCWSVPSWPQVGDSSASGACRRWLWTATISHTPVGAPALSPLRAVLSLRASPESVRTLEPSFAVTSKPTARSPRPCIASCSSRKSDPESRFEKVPQRNEPNNLLKTQTSFNPIPVLTRTHRYRQQPRQGTRASPSAPRPKECAPLNSSFAVKSQPTGRSPRPLHRLLQLQEKGSGESIRKTAPAERTRQPIENTNTSQPDPGPNPNRYHHNGRRRPEPEFAICDSKFERKLPSETLPRPEVVSGIQRLMKMGTDSGQTKNVIHSFDPTLQRWSILKWRRANSVLREWRELRESRSLLSGLVGARVEGL